VNNSIKHINLDNIFIKIARFNPNDKIAIIGIRDLSIIPALTEKLKENIKIALIFNSNKTYSDFTSYMNEYKLSEKILSFYFDLEKISSWNDNQFDQIFCLNIDLLKKEPIGILSEFLRLLKDNRYLNIIMENTDKNEVFLKRLLYVADMGEIIGLLEKVGFSNKFYIRKFIDKELKAVSIRAIKPRIEPYSSEIQFK
jgi:hypothetical protein